MDIVYLVFLKTEYMKDRYGKMLESLSESEIKKIENYRTESSRLLTAGGSWLVRKLLGKEAVISTAPNGKPKSEKVFFNISHSVDTVGMAFSFRHEVGLDLEKKRILSKDLSDRCLTSDEKKSGEDFLTLFTAKESLAKAEGGGISRKLTEIPALPVNGKVYYSAGYRGMDEQGAAGIL